MFLAAAAESLAHASQVLNSLSINAKDNVNELELRGCGLESEAKLAMQQYLSEKEGKDAAAEDFSLCHIYTGTRLAFLQIFPTIGSKDFRLMLHLWLTHCRVATSGLE